MTPDALEPLATSSAEIAELVERFAGALSDANVPAQSVDGRYVDAYTAGFLLAKVVVRASGFRVKGGEIIDLLFANKMISETNNRLTYEF